MAATWGFGVWSGNAWGSDNNINVVSGIGASFSLGSVTVDAELNSGWGRLTWGENAWGEQGDVVLSGISMSASLGDEVISIDVNPVPTGIPLTAAEGTVTEIIAVEVPVTGINLTSNLGTADAGPDAMLQGIGGTASVGSVEAYNLEGWGRYFWGQYEWGATGEWDIVPVTGISLSANVGSLAVVADANTDVTGEAMTAEEGTVDPAPDAEVTGIGFEADLAVGTVVIGSANVVAVGEGIAAGLGLGELDAVTLAAVNGISMTANVGTIANITGHANVFPTGFGLTMALGTTKTLVWNQVDTGTAPVDPPGWVEVAA
jgi:hypothetical protein